jgi:MHS family alpha-ketoglutarate permease-like MFS transporter
MGGTAAFYTWTTYVQKFLKLSVKLTDNQTTFVTLGALVFAMVLQPIYGAISDRVGRKPVLMAFGILGTLCTVPLLTVLHDAKSPLVCLLLVCAAWMIVSGYTSINAVVKAELFPAEVRATGVAVPYALMVATFGGTVDYVALWFKDRGTESYFYYYLSGVIFLSLLIYATMRDTKRTSLIE